MNYYPFHVGDYAAHTKHLTLMGDLAYRRLLDLYYINEAPLPLDPAECARKIGMRDHIQDVSEVLSDFFLKSEEGYRSKRCDAEIESYQAKAERAKQANTKRWEAKKSEVVPKPDLKSEADQIPTNNQEPITNNQIEREKTARATRMPADMEMPDEWGEWCEQNRPDLVPREVFEKFKDHWIAKPGKAGTKLDWLATWRNWVREERQQQIHRPSMQPRESFSERDERRARERYEEMTGKKSSTVIDITPAQLRVTA